MVKKIIGLMIGVLLLFSLVACNTSKEDKMKIPFDLSNKTTNYFDTDERETLLQIVNSLDELTKLMGKNEFLISPMYEESFFDNHKLVLYFFIADIYNELDITFKAQDDSLVLHKTFDFHEGSGLTAERSWTFIIEIKNKDIVGLTQVKLK